MKNILIPAAIATATMAIVATVASKVAEATTNRSKLLDLVTDAYTNYRARREYLRTYAPHATELEEGRKMLDNMIRIAREYGKEKEAVSLENIRANISKDTAEAQQSREVCLSDKYSFDGDSTEFLGEISGYDVDQLSSTLRLIREATGNIERSIKKIESSAKCWLFEYKGLSLAMKLWDNADECDS